MSRPPARGVPVDKRMRNGYDPRTAATRKMRVVPVRPRQARPLPLQLALPRMLGTSHIAICDVPSMAFVAVSRRDLSLPRENHVIIV